MIRLTKALVVEGKYDQQKLQTLVDGLILRTDGFRLFSDPEKCALLKKMAHTTGIIVLTDSDVAGFRIRNHIKSVVGETGDVTHLYIPAIEGKEKRKRNPSKEGTLGVEGMTAPLLRQLLSSVTTLSEEDTPRTPVTKLDFYEDGLTGASDSKQRRLQLLSYLNLPPYLSTNALLQLINALYDCTSYRAMMETVFSGIPDDHA